MFCSFAQKIFVTYKNKILKHENLCSLLNNVESGRNYSAVTVEKDNNITLIGINREASRNSIDSETSKKLTEAFQLFEEDKSSPVGVLYGVGGSLSAGYDLLELEKQVESGSLEFLTRLGDVGPTRRHIRKPIVCGINGFCFAGGLELALSCDLRVIEDTAVLGFLNRRVGIPLSDVVTTRLARIIGYSQALDLIMTGRKVCAKEAFRIGLVNRLVAVGTALGQAVHLAFCIAKYPQNSLKHDRRALLENIYKNYCIREGIQNEINLSPDVVQEMKNGLETFATCDIKTAQLIFWNRNKLIPDWEKDEITRDEMIAATKNAYVKHESP